MSAKGRAAKDYVPDPNGFFATQPKVTRAIIPFLGIKPGMRILEPSCGTGAIGKVLRETFGDTICIVGVEIDKKRAERARKAKATYTYVRDEVEHDECLPVFDQVICSDFYQCDPSAYPPFDIIITNPSFSIWLPFAEHCFKHEAQNTTFLLPFNALASMKRMAWWKQHPAHARILSRRPSFAISVRCLASTPRGRDQGLKDCSFQELIALDAKPKKDCPRCGSPTVTTSSDSSEYMWATWSPDITQGLWDVIETPSG